jgi:prepilin peptidase CpaA
MSPDVTTLAVVLGTAPAAIIDLRTRRVPNLLTASLAAAGVFIAYSGAGRIGPTASVLGLAVGLAVMLPPHLLGGTGGGDVKLFAALGTLLGPHAIFTAFFYTALAGGLLALVIAFRRGRGCRTLRTIARLVSGVAGARDDVEHPSADNRFAYAPAIAVGAVLAVLGY